MKKGAKKKNRKLRRQVRKTVGALFMASAIVVAAIPVQDVSANPTGTVEKIKVAVTSKHGEITGGNTDARLNPEFPYESTVPYAQDIATDRKETPIVYTSGDGMFQFAYTMISETERGAVILNFNNVNQTDTIKIPDRLEAYRKYSPNVTFEGYCLVSEKDELLGYEVYEQKRNSAGELLYQTVNCVPDKTTGAVVNQFNLTRTMLRYDERNDTFYYPYSQKTGVDKDGKDVFEAVECGVEPTTGAVIKPCYYNQKSVWESLISTDQDLYYLPKNDDGTDKYGDDNWLPADNSNHWRINAKVAFIGAETIEENVSGWSVSGYRVAPGEGVFAGRTDITNLVIEASLMGIADYAFYNCGTLTSVEFQNGSIETIGNGAFAGCRQLQSVSMPRNSLVKCIGKDAFYGCESLQSFVVPDGLEALGDCAFEGCKALTSVNLLGSGKPIALRRLGNHLFRGCSSLSGIEFPDGYNETLDIDMFEGCSSLQYVKLPLADNSTGKTIDFKVIHALDTTNYPNCGVAGKDAAEKTANAWKEFRDTHPESFYFEGPDISSIHTTANDNSVTYKYPNQELYEKVVYEHDAVADKDKPDGKTAKTIYQVDNNGTLVKFDILDYALNTPSRPDIITIPETIGGFGIKSIGSGSFNNNCYLKKVTIPASVTTIGANAFKGCHSLRTVIFTDATKIVSIGADAFKTQAKSCSHTIYPDTPPSTSTDIGNNGEKPWLYFVGAMLKEDGSDTETFKFAMSGADTSKISHGNSDDIWITCHSGWPTNLEVQYYSDPGTQTGEAQLVSYPRFSVITKNVSDWVDSLPYVSAEQKAEYVKMIDRAIQYNAGNTPPIDPPLTPNESDFLAATLDLTIPESVDSIKPGLFSGVDKDGKEVTFEYKKVKDDGTVEIVTEKLGPDTKLHSITINGVDELEKYAFKGCTSLNSASIIGSRLIGDYAFEGCTALTEATIGSNLEDTGMRPFKGCTELSNINCFDPGNFTYSNGILYRNVNGGKEIVECLENRGTTGGTGLYTVGPDELQGVTAIKKEAFAECKDVAQVDLSKTSIGAITEGSFKDMELNSIVLPNSLSRIDADAFKGNTTRRFIVYYKNSNPITMLPDAFEPAKEGDGTIKKEVIFQCSIPSNAATYAEDYAYITVSDEEVYEEFTVNFYNTPDYPASTNLELLSTQTIRAGEDAEEPSTEGLKCNNDKLAFIGWDKPFTNVRSDLNILAMYGSPQYTVIFLDGFDGKELGRETVSAGGSATLPEVPSHPGYEFTGWDKPHYDIQADTTIVAKFVDASGDASRFTVSFYLDDGDEEPWWETHASNGEVVRGPIPPARAGYTFVRWIWAPASSETGVKQDTSVYAQWAPGNGGNPSGNPGGSGNHGGSSDPNATRSPGGSSSPSASPSSSPEVTKYTVSVSGGSGSGRYAAGEIVAVNAYYMGEGQAFDRWTSSTAGVGFSNPNATSATFTMPAANVAITATYKTGSGTASNSAGGGSGAGAGGSSGGSGTTSNNGTTVEVTKPGISNTNYAGATVSGATDNFIVKVTEDQSATDAVVAALQARYGDISRIQYLPMDISLYDSTGRTRIADTTGITVNLTLPLPDDLVQYAGNNKVAAISNGALEDLNVRFTTVGGVPCVNFTATHFSPYVIYVDTANLTEATIDTTPKTGDPIHPKWFLALGMACISLVLFFKRDKVVVKSKTA